MVRIMRILEKVIGGISVIRVIGWLMGSLKGVIHEFGEKDEESGQRMARIMRIYKSCLRFDDWRAKIDRSLLRFQVAYLWLLSN